MRLREHPQPALLLRFLEGEATRAENRTIVRHLLGGCRACLAVARPAWEPQRPELQEVQS